MAASLQRAVELKRRGLMFILSSPSGAGKTTLSRRLLGKYKNAAKHESIVMSVSVTTRPMRPGEVHGKDYFFVDNAAYEKMVKNGEMLEHARVFEHQYGTPAAFVRDHTHKGIDVLFDIDWQGTRQLAAKNRDDLVSIFILPPSMRELERRLHTRAQDSDAVVKKRMEKATSEISHWQEYDYVLINQDIDETLEKIDCILKAERLKRVRQEGMGGFVQSL
ncbi:MAG: guanylate kinase [Pseudomonadota bacterium]|nr:guanylate kinase [Pseudomonadota bacterium]MDE3038561.1 guanylate kinase [Pseudomonadota bacterium]